jgi:hypothetical protein
VSDRELEAPAPVGVNRRAIWAICLVGIATIAYVTRDSLAVGLFGLPSVGVGEDGGLARYWGALFIPVLIAGLVLGHMSVRKSRRGLKHWRLGALALVLGYAFLATYLVQVIFLLIVVLLFSSGSGLTF